MQDQGGNILKEPLKDQIEEEQIVEDESSQDITVSGISGIGA